LDRGAEPVEGGRLACIRVESFSAETYERGVPTIPEGDKSLPFSELVLEESGKKGKLMKIGGASTNRGGEKKEKVTELKEGQGLLREDRAMWRLVLLEKGCSGI